MEPNSDIPKEIPLEVQMAEISEKMQHLNHPFSDTVAAADGPSSSSNNVAAHSNDDNSGQEGQGQSSGAGTKSMSMSVDEIIAGAEASSGGGDHNGPIVMIIVGMAGSGKTTLTQRLTAELLARKSPPYIVNLDPACNDPPYPVNIGN
jgi:polynucleotide 5'-kinase involved in rRNA processing